MSKRYSNKAWSVARATNGWDGAATREALHSRLCELWALGITATAAGCVLAREYQLYSSLQGWQELA
jgi:hypothetical protein